MENILHSQPTDLCLRCEGRELSHMFVKWFARPGRGMWKQGATWRWSRIQSSDESQRGRHVGADLSFKKIWTKQTRKRREWWWVVVVVVVMGGGGGKKSPNTKQAPPSWHDARSGGWNLRRRITPQTPSWHHHTAASCCATTTDLSRDSSTFVLIKPSTPPSNQLKVSCDTTYPQVGCRRVSTYRQVGCDLHWRLIQPTIQ